MYRRPNWRKIGVGLKTRYRIK